MAIANIEVAMEVADADFAVSELTFIKCVVVFVPIGHREADFAVLKNAVAVDCLSGSIFLVITYADSRLLEIEEMLKLVVGFSVEAKLRGEIQSHSRLILSIPNNTHKD
jgi:hypothetical protein